MAERGQTSPELVERNQLLLIRLDQPRDPGPEADQFLGGDVTLDVDGVASAEVGQAAIDLGPDQGGVGEQLDDPGPDERVQGVLPDRSVIAAAPLWETVGVGTEATIVNAPATRGPRRATVERVAADLTDQQALQQGRLLGVACSKPPILVEAFLGERKLRRSDQRRHGNLDPFRARAWTRTHRARSDAAALS